MALNRFMHPRNIYKEKPPSFRELSDFYPGLKPYIVQKVSQLVDVNDQSKHPTAPAESEPEVSLDFENPAALRALTCALLQRDFQLGIDLPLTKLIPTVPSRLNYLLWIEDLLHAHHLDGDKQTVHGLDIGSGASCIYALLGWRKNGWSFVTTESDEEALRYAQENVARNNATENIAVLRADGSTHLLGIVNSIGKYFTFCMCNPPFFGSLAERDEKAAYKPPKHACNPVDESDAVVEGGEVAFVSQMITESLQLKDRVKIYSSMLGKKCSVAPLKALLASHQISFTNTEFCQGRTMRWGLAWSFSLDLKAVAVLNPHKHPARPLSYELSFGAQSETDRMRICLRVIELLEKDLAMYVVNFSGGERSKWRVSAEKDLWSHQRRKRRMHCEKETDDVEMVNAASLPASHSLSRSPSKSPDSTVVSHQKSQYLIQFSLMVKADSLMYAMELQWIEGKNREDLHGIVVYLKNHLKEFLL